jgi:hypothetical protein
MTTIALKDSVLAADSYATDETCAIQVAKCVRLPGGDVAGGAGDVGEVSQALAWLAAGGKGEPPDISSSGILFTDKGVSYLASTKWPGVRVKGFAAIGSGSQGAMVAMKLGKSAEDAVRAVIGVDPCTGGEIDVLPVGKPRAPRKRK